MTGVALFRGVNVGGANRLPMAVLKDALVAAGGVAPETYIQSGNAVFGGTVSPTALADGIERRAGFRTEAVILSGASFLTIVAANPFPEAEADPKALHVFFLPGPSPADPATLDAAKAPEEGFLLTPRALYLHTPKYLTGSALAKRMDRLLGVRATARNWRTVAAVAGMVRLRG